MACQGRRVMAEVTKELPIGYESPPVSHIMTLERMTVYSDMEVSTSTDLGNKLVLAPRNIHNDPQYAKSHGLPATIADGLISTAWVEAELRGLLGKGFLKGGKVATKYLKPIFAGDTVTIKMTLKEKLPEGSATRLILDVSCFNQNGDLVVVGSGGGLME